MNKYYAAGTGYLSNSMVGDFLKDPNYFYRKHVQHYIQEEPTEALILGSAVDVLLTESQAEFDKQFIVGYAKDLKGVDIADGVQRLTPPQFDEIVSIVEAVKATDAYKDLKGHTAQEALLIDHDMGQYFKGLCGKPDWYKVDGNVCIITDLKTARSIDQRKYYYHCVEFGYFRQQAFYQFLLGLKFPNVRSFISRHLVVDKEENINNVRAYILDQNEVDERLEELVITLSAIKNEKTFAKFNPTWEQAGIIMNPIVARDQEQML